jgi:hypothetical protein
LSPAGGFIHPNIGNLRVRIYANIIHIDANFALIEMAEGTLAIALHFN